MARRFTLAVFGCVPSKFARITELDSKGRVTVKEDKDGHICEFKRPKYAVQILGEVLDMMGLKSEEAKHSGSDGKRSREYVISAECLDLMRAISNAHIPPILYDLRGDVCVDHIENLPPVSETLFDIPANDDASMSGTERAIRNEVRALLHRFNGLPASETATVWLPLAGRGGMQQTMQIPVPDCFMIREEHIYELPGTSGAYFSFPFNIDVPEAVMAAVREVPEGKRAFIMESSPGVEYVVYVDAMDAPKKRAFIRAGYDRLTA